jgi:hypothetical protein
MTVERRPRFVLGHPVMERRFERRHSTLDASGPNTFPYFRESGERRMRDGDLVCLDTDATGYLGYAVDFSRSFLCGDGNASAAQRDLFGLALEQLQHNAGLLAARRDVRAVRLVGMADACQVPTVRVLLPGARTWGQRRASQRATRDRRRPVRLRR